MATRMQLVLESCTTMFDALLKIRKPSPQLLQIFRRLEVIVVEKRNLEDLAPVCTRPVQVDVSVCVTPQGAGLGNEKATLVVR